MKKEQAKPGMKIRNSQYKEHIYLVEQGEKITHLTSQAQHGFKYITWENMEIVYPKLKLVDKGTHYVTIPIDEPNSIHSS